MSEVLRLYHGSPIRVKCPLFGVGNPYNDYGLGFYCTESFELACEWACPKAKDGFANAYDLELAGLRVVDLDAEPYGTIEWLAVLFANRQFDVPTSLMEAAKSYVAPDTRRSWAKRTWSWATVLTIPTFLLPGHFWRIASVSHSLSAR